MLGKLTRKYKSDGRLDLSGGDSGSLGVSGKLSSLDKGSLEDVGDEGVHDGHALLGDTAVRVHLLQHLVDVGGEGLHSLALLLLLVSSGLRLGGFSSFLGWGLCHVVKFDK